jgi:hypothetical protein
MVRGHRSVDTPGLPDGGLLLAVLMIIVGQWLPAQLCTAYNLPRCSGHLGVWTSGRVLTGREFR